MNIIFLDIDGVLNSVDSMIAFGHQRPMVTEEDALDPISVGLLLRLCIKCDAKIVISSTWRIGRTQEDFVDIFTKYGWYNFPVIGMTPVGGHTRGHEIQDWLDSNPWKNYIILDDDSDMLDCQSEQFVHVSNINGLRSKHYCQALRIFGKADERLEAQVNWRKHEI